MWFQIPLPTLPTVYQRLDAPDVQTLSTCQRCGVEHRVEAFGHLSLDKVGPQHITFESRHLQLCESCLAVAWSHLLIVWAQEMAR